MRYIQFNQPIARSVIPTAEFGGRLAQATIDSELNWLFGTAPAGTAPARRFPVDIYEDKDNTYVRAELPGVTREAIDVEVAHGTLSIQASRSEKQAGGEGAVSFSRLVSIPDEVHAEKISAAYENGILTVTLPRSEEAKPRKINVTLN
jgi:HSP20 family protein